MSPHGPVPQRKRPEAEQMACNSVPQHSPGYGYKIHQTSKQHCEGKKKSTVALLTDNQWIQWKL